MAIGIKDNAGWTDSSGASESWADKARREVELLGQGAGGFSQAAQKAIVDHPYETAAKLGLSAAAGLSLAYLGRTSGPFSLAARAAGTAAGFSFLIDVAVRGNAVFGALADNWRSGESFRENSLIIREHLGKFTFDTTLLSAGSIAGAAAGYRRFSSWAGKIPEEFSASLNCAGIRKDYLNSLQPAFHHADIAANYRGHLSEYKLSLAKSELQDALRKTPTYGDYWKQRIEAYQTAHETKIDAPATMKKFVSGTATTRELNSLTKGLQGLGNTDNFDEAAISDAYRYLLQIRRLSQG